METNDFNIENEKQEQTDSWKRWFHLQVIIGLTVMLAGAIMALFVRLFNLPTYMPCIVGIFLGAGILYLAARYKNSKLQNTYFDEEDDDAGWDGENNDQPNLPVLDGLLKKKLEDDDENFTDEEISEDKLLEEVS